MNWKGGKKYIIANNINLLLQEAVELNILNLDNVLTEVMSKKIEYIERIHPYTITPPKDSKHRWQTYYLLNGKRVSMRAKSKEALLQKLILYYAQQTDSKKITFASTYNEWLEYKKPLTSSTNTLTRYKQRYSKYLETSCINFVPIRELDDLILEKELNRIVKENQLSRKEWVNLKTILRGVFSYALRKRYITQNPLEDVNILVKFKQVSRKPAIELTFNTEEKLALEKYLDTKYHENEDLSFLAIKMNLNLGLRVGELVALKWTDIISNKELHVVREEVRNQETGIYSVVEHTKTNTDRFVYLVPKVQKMLELIPRESGFIFSRNGNRITSRQISYVLEKYAQVNGIKVKSTHKMRRTYASTLAANNVPLECIREQLGHSSLLTTMGYIHNPLTKEETYNLLKEAL